MKNKPTIQNKLRQIAPSVSFTAHWTPEDYSRWDGYGPDPRKRGYVSHDVEIKCSAIVNGEVKSASDYLGSCYDKPGKLCPDVHGYYPQMAGQAASELLKQVDNVSPVAIELKLSIEALKTHMREQYDEQQKAA